jgi:hypothetical protein
MATNIALTVFAIVAALLFFGSFNWIGIIVVLIAVAGYLFTEDEFD